MNTFQLTEVMENDRVAKRTFLGVFPMDMLPKYPIQHRPCSFIVNSAPSTDEGKHWLAVYIDEDGGGELFDSYGYNANFYDTRLEHFLQRNCNFHVYNTCQLQSLLSDVCGQFCLFYLLHRSRGIPADSIVRLFSEKKRENDHLVANFINKHFPNIIQTHSKAIFNKTMQTVKTRQECLLNCNS